MNHIPMISREDPRVHHARALFVLAAFILVAGQFLPKSPYTAAAGWTRWVDMGEHLSSAWRGRADQRELVFDGVWITSALFILSAPFLAKVFARSTALLWTARFFAAGTWAAWLAASNYPGFLTDGEHCMLVAVIVLVVGFLRLPAEGRPSPA